MSRGILLVAFGKEYDRIGAACAKVSRRNTNLPFYVLTNLHPSKRSLVWKDVSNVSFQIFDWPVDRNRAAKTRLPLVSPFDLSLYLDCDCVIQKKGVDEIFYLMENFGYDVVLNRYIFWERGDKVLKIYRRAMRQFKVGLPITIWNGGLVAFRREAGGDQLFALWNRMWKEFGRNREMPCLACAVAQSLGSFPIGLFPTNFFASDVLDENAVVQHHCPGFVEKFKLPQWERWVPFDTDPTDFTWVEA